MSDEMRIFYKLLKYSGLMAVYFDDSNNCYRIKNSIGYYLYTAVNQLILIASFLTTRYYRNILILSEYNETGNYFNYFAIQTGFVSHSILRLWLNFNQQKHLHLLEICRKWNLEYLNEESLTFALSTRNSYFVLAAVLAVYVLNLASWIYFTRDDGDTYSHLPWITFTYCCVISILIFFIYTRIVVVISNVLKWIALSCERLLLAHRMGLYDSDFRHLQNLMHLHDEVSYLTSESINTVYGIAILLCTILIIVESIWDLFVLAIPKARARFQDDFEMVLWMLPLCIFLVVGLLCNNVTEEVSLHIYIFEIR